MRLFANIDGASRGNPGPASVGVYVVDENGKSVRERRDGLRDGHGGLQRHRRFPSGRRLRGGPRMQRQRLVLYVHRRRQL